MFFVIAIPVSLATRGNAPDPTLTVYYKATGAKKPTVPDETNGLLPLEIK